MNGSQNNKLQNTNSTDICKLLLLLAMLV